MSSEGGDSAEAATAASYLSQASEASGSAAASGSSAVAVPDVSGVIAQGTATDLESRTQPATDVLGVHFVAFPVATEQARTLLQAWVTDVLRSRGQQEFAALRDGLKGHLASSGG